MVLAWGFERTEFLVSLGGFLGLRWERWEVLVAFEGGWVGVEAWVGHCSDDFESDGDDRV